MLCYVMLCYVTFRRVFFRFLHQKIVINVKKKEGKQGEDLKNSAGTEAARDTSALR